MYRVPLDVPNFWSSVDSSKTPEDLNTGRFALTIWLEIALSKTLQAEIIRLLFRQIQNNLHTIKVTICNIRIQGLRTYVSPQFGKEAL